MPRIRTIKPDFFKHYELFKAEIDYNLPLRIAFAGLWCCADREGRFKWKPMELKTDILPYDSVDFESVLDALHKTGFIRKYSIDGRDYGLIPSFNEHQRPRSDEAKSLIPTPFDGIDTDSHLNSDESTSWKGKERKGNGKEGIAPNGPPSDPDLSTDENKNPPPGCAPPPPKLVIPFTSQKFAELWDKWKDYRYKQHRKKYKSPESEQAALNHLVNLAEGVEETASEIIMQSMGNTWQGLFKLKDNGRKKGANSTNGQQLNAAFNAFYSQQK